MQTIRIFISSPGDVQEERDRARNVIHQLRRRYAGRLQLEALLWEELPLQATLSFQEGIDVVLSDQGPDIAVFILWSRLGSPLSQSIRKPDGSSYLSGTEREWDLMMCAREASSKNAGVPKPDILVYTRRDDAAFLERLRARSDAERQAELSQKQLLTQFIREEFRDAETGHNIRAYHSFDQPTTFAQQLRTHLVSLLDRISGSVPEKPVWEIEEKGPPFRGLDAFEFEHAPIFFGREDEIVSIRQKLREQACRGCAFVLISGSSGSGKSSLARAGVLPDVVQFEVDGDVKLWRWLVTNPQQWGPNKVSGFVEALCEKHCLPELKRYSKDLEFKAGEVDFDQWLTVLRLRVRDTLESIHSKGGQARAILLVDQLEELFTDKAIDEQTRRQVLSILESLARSGLIWVLATVRSDFYHLCQNEPILVRMKEGAGQFDLLPATSDALARLINEPATLSGLRYERSGEASLSDLILREAVEHKELLPMLEHLLWGLCRQRSEDGTLSFATYQALGGISGALQRHCEETLNALPANVQAKLNNVLAEVVSVSGDRQESFVRRAVPMSSFEQDADAVALVNAFVNARLFTSSQSVGGEASVSVAHEALLRSWPRVSAWIAENREFLRLRVTIEQYQKRWLDNSKNVSLLLRSGLPLEEGRRLQQIASSRLDPQLSEYVDQSNRYEQERRMRSINRRRLAMAVLSTLCVVLAGLGIYSYYKAEEARAARNDAIVAKSAADKAKNTAEDEQKKAQSAEDRTQKTLDELTTQSQAAAKVLFDFGVEDYEAYQANTESRKLDSAYEKLFRAWELRRPDDPLKGPYAAVLADRLSLGGRLWARFNCEQRLESLSVAARGTQIWAVSQPQDQETVSRLRAWDLRTGKSLADPMVLDNVASVLAINRDNSLLAIGYSNGEVDVREITTGKVVVKHKLDDHVRTLAFSNAGKLVCASSYKELFLIDLSNGEHYAIPARQHAYIPIVFSPDDNQFATADGRRVRLWDSKTRMPIGQPLVCPGDVSAVAYTPDGSRLAIGSGILTKDDSTLISWWDPRTLRMEDDVTAVDDALQELKFSPDGSRFATVSAATLQLWNWPSKTKVGKSIYLNSNNIEFTSDGSQIATGFAGAMMLVNVNAWEIIAEEPADTPVDVFAYSPDSERIAIVQGSAARVRNAETGLFIGTNMNHSTQVEQVSLSSDGRRLLTTIGTEARLWDVSTSATIGDAMAHEGSVLKSVTFSPDGNRILTIAEDKSVRLWNGLTAEPINTLPQSDQVIQSAVFSSDSSKLFTTISGGVLTWNASNGSLIGKSSTLPKCEASYIGPEGDRAVVFVDGDAQLWDVKDGKMLNNKLNEKATEDSPPVFIFLDGGKRLVSESYGMLVRNWDATTGNEVIEKFVKDYFSDVSFSQDAKMVAIIVEKEDESEKGDGEIQVWNLDTMTSIGEPIEINGGFKEVGFSPDRSKLAAITNGGRLIQWAVDVLPSSNVNTDKVSNFNSEMSSTEFSSDELLLKAHARKEYLYRSSTAIDAIELKQWFTAKFHLPWLIEHEPDNPRWKDMLESVNTSQLSLHN